MRKCKRNLDQKYDIICPMKGWQEYAIVIALGLLVSLVTTVFLFWRSDDNPIVIPTPPPAPSSPPPVVTLPDREEKPIILTSPDNEAVYDNKAISIAGEASPGALVVLFVNTKNFVVTADARGDFRLDVNLDSGSNVIKATMVDDRGVAHTDERLVVYTNKSLEEILLTEEELHEAVEQKPEDETPEDEA